MVPRLHVPLVEPEDVVRHLGHQEKHWKEGRSAHALTRLWTSHNGLPPSIQTILQDHSVFRSVELIDGFLERQVDLGSAGRPSQTDLLAIVALDEQIAVVAIEGKAGETFGSLVADWDDGSTGKRKQVEKSMRNAPGVNRASAKPALSASAPDCVCDL